MFQKITIVAILLISMAYTLSAKQVKYKKTLTPYVVAHKMLPYYYFKNPSGFLSHLHKNHKKFFTEIMDEKKMNSNIDSTLKTTPIEYNSEKFKDIYVVVLKFPKPKKSTEAYFIAMAEIKFRGTYIHRYFTLEKLLSLKDPSKEQSVFCEWNRKNEHHNFGYGTEGTPTKKEFLTMIHNQLKRDYNAKTPKDNVVGLEEEGLSYYKKGNYKKASEIWSKKCDTGIGEECCNLAFLYEKGYGVKKDLIKAVKLYSKACDGGYTKGCYNLGVFYSSGYGVKEDKKIAREAYTKACDGGFYYGCFNLGVLYEKGKGITKDINRAIKLYEKACNANIMGGCYNLGIIYATGKDLKQDKEMAKKLFAKGCKGRDRKSCEKYNLLNKEKEK